MYRTWRRVLSCIFIKYMKSTWHPKSHVPILTFHVLVMYCHVLIVYFVCTTHVLFLDTHVLVHDVMYWNTTSCTSTWLPKLSTWQVHENHVLVHDIMYWYKTNTVMPKYMFKLSTSIVQAGTCRVQEISKLLQDIWASCTLLVFSQNTSKYKISCTSTR